MLLKVIHPICCGADVHKNFVTATILITQPDGTFTEDIRTFSTMTNSLIEMREWLLSNNCNQIAIESTGKYWIPVFNILEDYVTVTLANPKHVKNIPGKKTDPNDSRWLAKLHRLGLVPGSFVPPRHIRELRELTRYRAKLINMRTSEKQRVHNTLTVCNIMLSNVASDVFGVSGKAIISSLLAGEELDEDKLAKITKKNLHKKIPELIEALNGKLSEHHISKPKVTLEHYFYINESIYNVEQLIAQKVKPYEHLVALLDTIPGINVTSAQAILAEIGTDMSVFHSALHLCSWAGVSPRNNESAGKKKNTKITKGDTYLKTILCQCAHAAVKDKDTRFSVKYHYLKYRRGPNKAIIAICRLMLIAIYHMLTKNEPFKNLCDDPYLNRLSQKSQKSMIKKLEALGYKVVKEQA